MRIRSQKEGEKKKLYPCNLIFILGHGLDSSCVKEAVMKMENLDNSKG